MMGMDNSLQVAITESNASFFSRLNTQQGRRSLPTVFSFLLVRLQANFDLDGRNRHDLHIFALRYAFDFSFRQKWHLPCEHGV